MEVKGEIYFYLETDADGNITTKRRYLLHAENCKNSDQDIAIMKCKLEDDPECLTRKKYSVPAEHTEKCSALFDAVYKDHHKCVAFMITKGANIWEIYRWYDIIETCLYRHRYKTLKYLINNNIVSSFFNPQNSGIVNALNAPNYYLLVAIKKECTLDIIKLFLNRGVKVDEYLNYDLELNHCPFKMPTVCAMESCNPLVLKSLLLHGGYVNSRRLKLPSSDSLDLLQPENIFENILSDEAVDCLSLIHHFILFSYTNLPYATFMLELLYQFGANLWELNRHGMTPLAVLENPITLNREKLVRKIRQENTEESEWVKCRIIEKLQELMIKPLNLKSWCRISLVQYKGCDYLKFIDKLNNDNEVPMEVLDFLYCDELNL